jgi:hypothetical protein
MKTRLPLPIPTLLCLLSASLVTTFAQGDPGVAPTSNYFPSSSASYHTPPSPAHLSPDAPPTVQGIIDPATGLPIPQPLVQPRLLDKSWNEPDIVLTNIVYGDLSLAEVVMDLRERFKDHFDILPLSRDQDWGFKVDLRLNRVRASEVFNAMNMVFENDRAPFRWEYGMNGTRPTAMLRVLPEAGANSTPPPEPPPAPKRPMVFFVGNLVGDAKEGGMTMNGLTRTLSEVSRMAYGDDVSLSFHDGAQIVVVKGTEEQIAFVGDTLQALKLKEQERLLKAAKVKPAEAKAAGANAGGK